MSPSPDLLETPGPQPNPTLELGQRAIGPTLDLGKNDDVARPTAGTGALVAICVVMGILSLAFLIPKSLEGSAADPEATTPGLTDALSGSLSSAFGSDTAEQSTVDEEGGPFGADGASVADEAEVAVPAADPAPAVSDLYVDITNSTGFPITEIYVSTSSSEDWGTDLLAGRTLAVGQTERVDLSGHSEAIFDIRLVDSDGDSYTYSGFNVLKGDIVATIGDIDT
jgi:hypothetical protein